MNKLKQTPLPILPHTRMQVLRHTHVAERLDSTNKQNAPTRVHMYTHTGAYISVYAYIYTDIHIYIYKHIHMHLYTHTCTHIYIRMHMHTYAQIAISTTTPQRVKQYHRRTYASICTCMHIHTHIHIHICAQPAARVLADVYVGVKTHLCNIHTCPCTSAQI